MTRGYDDTVHVRLADEPRPDGRDAPAQFLWRGRLYLVREVLGYWRERQAWWSLDPPRPCTARAGSPPRRGRLRPGPPTWAPTARSGGSRPPPVARPPAASTTWRATPRARRHGPAGRRRHLAAAPGPRLTQPARPTTRDARARPERSPR